MGRVGCSFARCVCSSVEHSVKRSMQIVQCAIEKRNVLFTVSMIGFHSFRPMVIITTMMVKMKMMHACSQSCNHFVGSPVLVYFSPAVLNRLHRMNVWRRCSVCQLNCILRFVCSFYCHLPVCCGVYVYGFILPLVRVALNKTSVYLQWRANNESDSKCLKRLRYQSFLFHTWMQMDRYLIVGTFEWWSEKEQEQENGWMAQHRSPTKLLLNYNSKSCNRFFVGHKDCQQNPYRYIIYHFTLSPLRRTVQVFFVLLCLMMFAYVGRYVKSECIKELLFTLGWCIDPSAHEWMSKHICRHKRELKMPLCVVWLRIKSSAIFWSTQK